MSETATTPPKTLDQYSPEELFEAWTTWKQRAAQAVNAERLIRAEIARRWFPTPKEGANNVELVLDGVERKLTLTQPVDRKVLEPELLALITQINDQTQLELEAKGAPPHPLRTVNFDKLIRRKLELATGEYKALTDVQKTYVETVLVIKDGSPQIELKPLKDK
jgi:Fe-S cluster biosynthesis and repair protein YggX